MTREEWARRSLREACERVEGSSSRRHVAVYRGAAQMAPYIEDGAVGRTEVARALLAAASSAGVDAGRAREIERTIDEAIAAKGSQPPWYPSSLGGGEHNRPRQVRFRGKVYTIGATRASAEIPDWAGSGLPACAIEDDRVWVTVYPARLVTQGDGDWWAWSDLAEMVREPIEWGPGGKDSLPLWCAAEIEGDDRGRRPMPGVDATGKQRDRECEIGRIWALVLDYDTDPTWSIDQVRAWWGGVRYVAHSTSSHNLPKKDQEAHGRGRVVVALSRPVTEEEQASIAAWARASNRGEMGRTELRNVRLGYYVPAVAPGGYESDYNETDQALDVDAILGMAAKVDREAVDMSPDAHTWSLLDLRPGKEGDDSAAARDHNLNITRILDTDPRWAGRVRRNLFSGHVEIDGRTIRDEDETGAGIWLGEVYRIHPPTTRVHEVMALVADRAGYHPIRDYLGRIVWDRAPRLHTWLHQCMGCDNDDISAAIGTRWMIAAVARVFAPGCKVDEMLILKGAQGAGKSRALQALCPDPSWFSDTALPIGEKDAFQQLAGVWIYELGEMASVRGREWEHVKAFLSSQVDRYRASYGRNTVQVPRQVIFCGSTNESAFLGDSTGQRRFWVREIGRCSPERVTELRDQLWAEAVHMYRSGEQWHMTGQEAVAAGESAERYRQVDPWEDPIREYCQGRTSVTVREILEKVLDKKVDARTRGDEQRVIAVLAGERVREHTKSGNVWRIRQ